MRTETVVCDRCRRDLRDVPDAQIGQSYVDKCTVTFPDRRRIDLCGECVAAFVAWVDLGEGE